MVSINKIHLHSIKLHKLPVIINQVLFALYYYHILNFTYIFILAANKYRTYISEPH